MVKGLRIRRNQVFDAVTHVSPHFSAVCIHHGANNGVSPTILHENTRIGLCIGGLEVEYNIFGTQMHG